ncbi:PepSY domain-containing protein [Acuticoccus kandeliae]|uniref:PepSY domain-containing protein n=1 Tax=Acuticoccus kandeliae TaxID=2073160 RepID=UPI000D3E0736|nr:PepSY domain-containing protein [Acuticoccus kandeliae]
MRNKTILLAALGVSLAAPVLAETVSPLPDALASVGFSEEGRRHWDHGRVEIWGTLPDGTHVEAHFNRAGLEDVEAKGRGAGLPIDLVDAIVGKERTAFPALLDLARLREIEIDDDGGVEIEGVAADGREIKAAFDRAGRLVDFKHD